MPPNGSAAAHELNSGGASLQRSLKLGQLIVYGLVFISPISPFPYFGLLFNVSHGMVPLTYVAGAVAMLFTAISYVTMTREYPVGGSVYIYASCAIGPLAGFVAGWAMLLDYILLPALVYVGTSIAVHSTIPSIPQNLVVVALIVICTSFNMTKMSLTARVNLALLTVQLGILAVFFLLAAKALHAGAFNAHWSVSPILNRSFTFPALLGGTSLVVLSFLGFDAIALLAEEADGGRHIIGQATILSLLISAVLFFAQTYVASLFVLNQHAFATGDATYSAFYAICRLIGGPGLLILASIVGVLFQGLASGIVVQAAAARLVYSMSRDGTLPTLLSAINKRTRTPHRAALAIALSTGCIAFIFSANFEILSSIVSFGALVGFILLHLSVLWLFMQGLIRRLWWTHLLVPVIGIVIVGYVLLNTQEVAKLAGIVWLAIGLLLFFLRPRRGGAREPPC